MTVLIYGSPASTCTQRILCVLDYCNVDYKFADKQGFAWIKDPEYIDNLQPFGQMPAIEDGDFKLFESRAISTYIVQKYGASSGLLPSPSDVEAVAKYTQAVFTEAFNFDPSASGIAAEIVFKPMHGGKTDEARLEYLTKTLDSKLQGYDRMLSKTKYLAGDKLSLVDLFHLPYGTMAIALGKGEGFTKYKNVARWWNDISSLKAWKFAEAEAKKAKGE